MPGDDLGGTFVLNEVVPASVAQHRHAEVACLRGEGTDMDPLYLCIFGEPGNTQFPSDARLLVAAEGAVIPEGVIGVDPDGPGLHLPGDSFRPRIARREDAAAEAVNRIVGDRDRLVVVVELQYANHRPKISSWAIRIEFLTFVKMVGA